MLKSSLVIIAVLFSMAFIRLTEGQNTATSCWTCLNTAAASCTPNLVTCTGTIANAVGANTGYWCYVAIKTSTNIRAGCDIGTNLRSVTLGAFGTSCGSANTGETVTPGGSAPYDVTTYTCYSTSALQNTGASSAFVTPISTTACYTCSSTSTATCTALLTNCAASTSTTTYYCYYAVGTNSVSAGCDTGVNPAVIALGTNCFKSGQADAGAAASVVGLTGYTTYNCFTGASTQTGSGLTKTAPVSSISCYICSTPAAGCAGTSQTCTTTNGGAGTSAWMCQNYLSVGGSIAGGCVSSCSFGASCFATTNGNSANAPVVATTTSKSGSNNLKPIESFVGAILMVVIAFKKFGF